MITLEFYLEKINAWLWGDWLLFFLVGTGILYTVITGGIQIRYFGYIMRKTLCEPFFDKTKRTNSSGTVSSFQALFTAIASCVGSGNIVGVSTAVIVGGLGAIFWMWFAAAFGMATKYGEIVLGMKYRIKDEKGQYMGGPFYYIEKGLKAPKLATLCAFFMVIQIIGGNFIQSNTISGVMRDTFAVPTLFTGIIVACIILSIVLGGLKRLVKTAQRVVPLMALFYILSGLVVIVINIEQVPSVLLDIVTSAFSLKAVGGGTTGTLMMLAMQKGVARGLYSNEAGEGSAPVLHSAADVKHPVQQGIAGVTEVFIDTMVICTITGLVLGVTGILNEGLAGNVVAIHAFSSVWGPMRYIVSICLLLFCLTSLMSQWYFGFVGLYYIFGFKVADKFKYIFPFFCIIGAMLKINMVWLIQDMALALLTIPNLIAMLVLFPQVRASTKDFFSSDLYLSDIKVKKKAFKT